MILAAAPTTAGGSLLIYVMFPVLVFLITAGPIALWRASKAAKARSVAAAVAAAENTARLNTQDQALARLLEVISPVGAPNLTAVLARIQADGAAQAQRLDDHIRAAAADKQAFESRLARIGGGL